jgi:hypothetical protein
MSLETHFCTRTQGYLSLVPSCDACHCDLEVIVVCGLVSEVFGANEVARFSFFHGSLWEGRGFILTSIC